MSTLHASDFYFEGGDFMIIVVINEQLVHGLVYSQVLSLVSDVWKLFLFPPFPCIESASEGHIPPEVAKTEKTAKYTPRRDTTIERKVIATLDFTEDDPEALLILLKLAHHRATDIPINPLPGKLLFHLANLIEQYQVPDLVKHFVPEWIDVFRGLSANRRGYLSQEEIVFVAYVFGREGEFVNRCTELVEMLHLVDGVFSGQYKSIRNKKFLDLNTDILPPGVLNHMREAHHLGFAALLNVLDKTLVRLQSSTNTTCQKGDKDCDILLHSALVVGLIKRDLWPLKETRGRNGCLWELNLGLRNMRKDEVLWAGIHYHEHRDCLSALGKKCLWGLHEKWSPAIREAVLGPAQKAHMDRARARLSLK